MAVAGGSRARLAYVAEVSYGVTPSNPAFQVINPTGHSVGLEKEGFMSETIRSDRQINDFRHGVRQSAGEVGFEFRDASLDDWLEAALMGTWTADVLKAGTTRRSFTIERYFADIARYRRSVGCEINSLSIECPASGIVTGSFGIIGKDDSGSGTAIAGAAYTDDPTEIVMDSLSGSVLIGTAAIGVITGISLSLENAIENQAVVGENTRIRGAAGRSNLTGQVTAFYEDDTLLDLFDNEDETSITFELTDGVAVYTFELPRVKFNGGKPEVSGEREITLTLPFQALLSDADDTQIIITRA
jgi:hypothetical protein